MRRAFCAREESFSPCQGISSALPGYADGDLFDAKVPAGYHILDRAGLYQWGPDLPDDFLDAKMTPRRLLTVLKTAVTDRARFRKIIALKNSVGKPARPWR